MKITKRQLRRIIKEEKARLAEANPDGTVSDNEDAEIFVFFADVEERIEELAQFIVMDSERIGGRFRGTGLRKRAFQKVLEIIREDYKF